MIFREFDSDLWTIVQKYLPPTKPHIGWAPVWPQGLFNDILYILATGYTWHDVPANYGTNNSNRYHFELGEKGVYQAISLDLLWFEFYKKRNAMERFFIWIEAFKKVFPWYERYEYSFLKLIRPADNVMIQRVLG